MSEKSASPNIHGETHYFKKHQLFVSPKKVNTRRIQSSARGLRNKSISSPMQDLKVDASLI